MGAHQQYPTAPTDSPAAEISRGNGNAGRLCEWDACAPLSGRQERFATEACRSAWHDLHRPRIASPLVGHPRQGSIRSLILGALQDGQWHSAHELAAIAKADSHSVKARISKLKADGHRIETDLPNGNASRPHRYRLVIG